MQQKCRKNEEKEIRPARTQQAEEAIVSTNGVKTSHAGHGSILWGWMAVKSVCGFIVRISPCIVLPMR